MEWSMRILWAAAMLATILTTAFTYNSLKKSNTRFLRFLRSPTVVLFSALFIFSYYTMADSVTLADIQMFLQLMRQLANAFVQFAIRFLWATSSAKILLIESLLMTRLIEIAGPVILHSPKENEKSITNTSVTLFLVHWAFLLAFMLGACILMIMQTLTTTFYPALFLKSWFKRRAIIAPSVDRATHVASNSNQK
ncbi:hypothetical protein BCON_0230g00110 [Botryotinia convoluta]|uniref:Transmembrane protein n=1 Tax=Botryotinia convoluta TaxID=54673 RepID=A0A4Z1HI91_9HELO|nr:hypothetical protein BCON_0230g00110 [Botryotinia convoluta]